MYGSWMHRRRDTVTDRCGSDSVDQFTELPGIQELCTLVCTAYTKFYYVLVVNVAFADYLKYDDVV